MRVDFPKLVLCIFLCLCIGFIGSFYTVGEWYNALQKPSWTPPGWVFAPVWTFLYVLIGISIWYIWVRPDKPLKNKLPYFFFFLQIALNLLWPFVFFYQKSIGWSLVVMCFLWIAIEMNIRSFYPYSKKAAYLLIPYFLWVTYALTLNIAIWWYNG